MVLDAGAFRIKSRGPGLRCGVERLMEKLESGDRKVLQAALDDRDVEHAAIVRVLKAEGHKLSALTVGRHRNGECRCAG